MSIHRARSLRRTATGAERRLWTHLRNRQLGGFKFRRQQPLGPYVVDFLCIEARMIVEIDGGQHTPEQDARRTAFLEEEGYRIVRFWNADVLKNLDGVLVTILRALSEQPSPSRR